MANVLEGGVLFPWIKPFDVHVLPDKKLYLDSALILKWKEGNLHVAIALLV